MTSYSEKLQSCFCPNCGQPANRVGDQVCCEFCDAIFTVHQNGSARVRKVGVLDDIDKRLSALEDNQGEAQEGGWLGKILESFFSSDDDEDILPR